MYAEFFGLERSPFANTADPTFFFRTAEHEEALASLVYGGTQRRGLTVITGPPGCGRRCWPVADADTDGQPSALVCTRESGHDLVATLCRDSTFDIGRSATGNCRPLHTHLCERFCEGKTAVAILDEAQNLSLDTLEHLRMLGNLERENAKLLQIVLLGQPELIGVLRLPQMRQLCQRVFCACQLRALDRDQTRSYVRHRLTIAGASERELFTDEAIDLLHDRSGGLPRMINQIADSALLLAYGASRPVVDRIRSQRAQGDDALYGKVLPRSREWPARRSSALVTDRSEGRRHDKVSRSSHRRANVTVSQGLDERVRQGAEVAGRLARSVGLPASIRGLIA
jgi:general secretion pathway protein A